MTAPPAGTRPPPLAPPVHDGLAIASLILSIAWLGGLGSLLGFIFGLTAAGAARREHRQESGLALWGTVLGVIGLGAAVLFWGIRIWNATHTGTPGCDQGNPAWPYC